MNIVDSSGWLEYFSDTINAQNYAEAIEDLENLIVPSITIYEVFKKVCQEANDNFAFQVVAHMKQGYVVDLDLTLAILASKLSLENKLPMADSIILATANTHKATIWTQDSDFEGLQNVRYFKKLV